MINNSSVHNGKYPLFGFMIPKYVRIFHKSCERILIYICQMSGESNSTKELVQDWESYAGKKMEVRWGLFSLSWVPAGRWLFKSKGYFFVTAAIYI